MKSLYVHIPFCRAKCAYCDFLSFVPACPEDPLRYVRSLVGEMSRFEGEEHETVYVGGGTPSYLEPALFQLVLKAVGGLFPSRSRVEFTVEANPESLTAEHLELFARSGVSRISLGVQSFDDGALARIGRIARKRDILRAADLVAGSGFRNFNIDLIQGIQGPDAFRRDLEEAVILGPTHLSVYMLSIAEGTPLDAMAEAGLFAQPNDESSEELYEHTGSFLSRFGYTQYEVSNYAVQGCESVHNLVYWGGEDYRGVGLGAVSTIGDERRTNVKDLGTYTDSVERGRDPVREIERLDGETRLKERIMLGLRTKWGVKRETIARLAGGTRRAEIADFMGMLEDNGLVLPGGENLALSRKGLFRSNTIIEELWEMLWGRPAAR